MAESTLDARAARLLASVGETRRRIASGDTPELDEVARDLEAILAEREAETQRKADAEGGWKTLMLAFQDEVEGLVSDIERERTALRRHLKSLSEHSRAGSFYARGRGKR